MARKVLTIFAHPDDAEAFAGGTLLIWSTKGWQITLCIVTDGDKGSHDPHESVDRIVQRRRQEQEQAARRLGADLIWLGYEDGMVFPTLDLRKDLIKVIRQVRPHVVLTQDPTVWFLHQNYINHPDHRAVGQATLEACYPAVKKASIFPDLVAAGYPPHLPEELWLAATEQPNRWIDIQPVLEQKIQLMLCHASQFPPEATKLLVTRLAREAGQPAGLAAAEGFRVVQLAERTITLLGNQAPE